MTGEGAAIAEIIRLAAEGRGDDAIARKLGITRHRVRVAMMESARAIPLAPTSGSVLIKYEAACLALAEAHSVDEVKDIRDKTEAMRVYGIQSKNVDLEIMASDIQLRADRRLGELLIEAKIAGRLRTGPPRKRDINSTGELIEQRVNLADIGIDNKLSSRAQKIGSIRRTGFRGHGRPQARRDHA